jgi:hypothetical protein
MIGEGGGERGERRKKKRERKRREQIKRGDEEIKARRRKMKVKLVTSLDDDRVLACRGTGRGDVYLYFC